MNRALFELQMADAVARWVWPVLRPLFRRHLSRRCKGCVLPETYCSINEQGLCDECLKSTQPPNKELNIMLSSSHLTQELRDALRAHEGKGSGAYDALLLFSGGKDSTYMLHRLQKEHPSLRLLLVMVDNGFMSPIALQNAEKILKNFNVPVLRVRLKPSFVSSVFRFALTHLDRQVGYSIVDLLDGHMTFDTAKNLASSLRIPLILCGLARIQVENVFGPCGLDFPQDPVTEKGLVHAGIPVKEFTSKEDLHFWFNPTQHQFIPRMLLPMRAWDLSEIEVLEKVRELGFFKGRNASPLLTNNQLIPVISMAEINHFGFTCFEVEFAKMVRAGLSERNFWVNLFEMAEYSAKTGSFINEGINNVLQRLGLTKSSIGIKK